MAITDDNLHLGSRENDPTGVADCDQCSGTAVSGGAPCPSCRGRQELRNAWWNSGPGPERLRRKLFG